MNRRLRGSILAAAAGLALPMTAVGQTLTYIQPALEQGAAGGDIEEFVSARSVVSLVYAGDGGTDDVTITIQAFVVQADGTVTLINTPRLVPEGAGGFIDIDNGTIGEAGDDLDDAAGPTDVLISVPAFIAGGGAGASLQSDINEALTLAGATGAAGLQFDFVDAGGGNVATANPAGALTNGSFPEAATSPRILPGTVALVQARLDSSGTNPILIIESPFPLETDLGTTNPNDITPANVDENDLEVDDANDFAGAANPSGLVAPGNATVVGSTSQALQFEFDPAGGDVPQLNEFIRFAGTDATDFTGRRLATDTDGVQIEQSLVLGFRTTGAGGALVTDATPGAPVIEVFFNQPVDQSFSNVDFFEVDFANSTEELYTDGGGGANPNAVAAIAPGSTSSSLTLTLNALPAELSIAADGLIDDDDVTAGTFQDALISAEQLQVFVDEATFAGADLTSSLGGSFGGSGADDTGSTLVNDGIAPGLATPSPFAFFDTDGDGFIETIGVGFTEPVSLTGGTPVLTDFNIDLRPNVDITSPDGIDAFGNFPDTLPQSQDVAEFNPTAIAAGENWRLAGVPDRLSVGNAVYLTFDQTSVNWTGDGNGVNAPGTNGPGGAGTSLLTLDHPTFDVTDGSNNFNVPAQVDQDVAVDRAGPAALNYWFLTGDNIDAPTENATIAQRVAEVGTTDAWIGDETFNDVLAVVFGETLAGANEFEELVQIDGGAFNQTGEPNPLGVRVAVVGGDDNNIVILENTVWGPDNAFDVDGDAVLDDEVANPTLAPGSLVTWNASTDTDVLPNDGSNNDVQIPASAQPLVDRTSPYVRLIDDPNSANPLDSAFVIDNDDDNVADIILLQFTEGVDSAAPGFADAFNDFTVTAPSGVTVDAIAVSAGSPTNVELTLGGNNVSIDAEVALEYDGVQAQDPNTDGDTADSRLLVGLSGNALFPVAAAGNDFSAERIIIPPDGANIAVQTFEGIAQTSGGVPFPLGSRLTAYLATPVVRTIEATHNNIPFTIDNRGLNRSSINNDGNAGNVQSVEAFTNQLLGLYNRVYLHRDTDNEQYFTNFKDDANTIIGDTMFVSVTANNLSNITWRGTAESGTQNRASGSLQLAWDLFYSANGTLDDLFNTGFDFDSGSPVIAGQTVITSDDGSYTLNVTGPSTRFLDNAPLDPDAVGGLPIIVIAELPDGSLHAVSSLLSNIDDPDDGPLVFNPNNTQQNNDDSAPGVTTFNINLDNKGDEFLFDEWNLLGFTRASGFAERNADIPVMPNGNAEQNVFLGTDTDLVLVDPFDQFVYWEDTNGDGEWTTADSGNFVIDEDILDSFTFTADSNGVDVTPEAFVGGYATGFFLDSGVAVGVTQFGAQIAASSIFSSGDPFPNNNSTQGWGAFVLTNPGGYADGNAVLTANQDLDAFIVFENLSGAGTDIFAFPSNESRPGVDQFTTIFGHFDD